MMMLADRLAGSRPLLGFVIGVVAICSFRFCAPDAFAHTIPPAGEAVSATQARPGDKRLPPVSTPPSLGQTPDTRSIAGGLNIGKSIGRALPLGAPGALKVVRTATPAALPASVPEALPVAVYKELTAAFSGFTSNAGKIEIGMMADGDQRLLFVSIGGQSGQTFWRFAPPDQPEGWFDDAGKRVGGSILAEPKPRSRMSSQFGPRRYYGRTSGSGFHDGIDYEGRVGEPVLAAADGVVNHSDWHFEYGRTVKITHADRFETLYAHLSHFAEGIGPGRKVRKGQVIGYVGMTGRSTGPHLHFSTIVNGRFVDPEPYLSSAGAVNLRPDTLVLFRKWQQDVRAAAGADEPDHRRLQTGDDWTTRI